MSYIVVILVTAALTCLLTSWVYEEQLSELQLRIPTGPDPDEKTPGIPDEYLEPLRFENLFNNGRNLGVVPTQREPRG